MGACRRMTMNFSTTWQAARLPRRACLLPQRVPARRVGRIERRGLGGRSRVGVHHVLGAEGVVLVGEPARAGIDALDGQAQDGAQALERLTQGNIDAWHFELTYGGRTYTLTPRDVSLGVDTAATLDPLWQIGRGDNMLTRYLAMLSLRGDGRAEKPVLTYDMDAVDAFLAGIKADIDCDAVDATVTYVAGNSEPFRFTDELANSHLLL